MIKYAVTGCSVWRKKKKAHCWNNCRVKFYVTLSFSKKSTSVFLQLGAGGSAPPSCNGVIDQCFYRGVNTPLQICRVVCIIDPCRKIHACVCVFTYSYTLDYRLIIKRDWCLNQQLTGLFKGRDVRLWWSSSLQRQRGRADVPLPLQSL